MTTNFDLFGSFNQARAIDNCSIEQNDSDIHLAWYHLGIYMTFDTTDETIQISDCRDGNWVLWTESGRGVKYYLDDLSSEAIDMNQIDYLKKLITERVKQ